LTRQREAVLKKFEELKSHTQPIVNILEQETVTEQLQNNRDKDSRQLLEFLTQTTDFHPDMLETLYSYAKFNYECGNYEAAREYLHFYRMLVPTNSRNYLDALWGKLASEILIQDWEGAREEMNRLRTHIDSNPFTTEIELLQQRAWVIHWSLFVFFNHPKGKDDIVDLFLHNPSYLNTIQIICPHILRYITHAVVTNKKRRQSLKELVKVIQLEAENYHDPITELIECLYVKYDFDGAQQKLSECSEVFAKDFFLTACVDEFIESARLLIFEMFCRIHQCISIDNLAEKLNMERDAAERWIVNLIRNARLDAKIDSQKGHVIMGTKGLSVYEQVMESTKQLAFRAQATAFQLEKSVTEKHQQNWRGGGAAAAAASTAAY